MKAIHTWIAAMIILCLTAFALLILTSSCATRTQEPLPDIGAGTAGEGTVASDDPEQPPKESVTEPVGDDGESGKTNESGTENIGESGTEKATERATERVTETETEKPRPQNSLRYKENPDGSLTVVGLGEYRDACVMIPETADGKRVTAIAASAFYGCTSISAVQIPATVQKIGDLAFAGCQNLTYISVSEGNQFYCDESGVLYSADKNTLIQYPPARGGESVTIGVQLKRVSAMAFYGCRYLRVVYFEGTAAEWERVIIASGNYSLISAAISTKQPEKKSGE